MQTFLIYLNLISELRQKMFIGILWKPSFKTQGNTSVILKVDMHAIIKSIDHIIRILVLFKRI